MKRFRGSKVHHLVEDLWTRHTLWCIDKGCRDHTRGRIHWPKKSPKNPEYIMTLQCENFTMNMAMVMSHHPSNTDRAERSIATPSIPDYLTSPHPRQSVRDHQIKQRSLLSQLQVACEPVAQHSG